MNINIKLTAEQQESIQTEILNEMTALQLTNALFTKIAIAGENTTVAVNLKTALIAYIKECKQV